MEVWALEAYGAAYTLQEILTVKSDDVIGVPRSTKRSSRATTPSRRAFPRASVSSKVQPGLNVELKSLADDEDDDDLVAAGRAFRSHYRPQGIHPPRE